MKIPGLNKRSADELPEDSPRRNKRLLIELAVKSIFLFMIVITIIYGVIASIFGSSLIIPRSAEGVLDSAANPPAVRWTSESLRQVKVYDHEETQAGSRTAVASIPGNRFIAKTFGVTRTPTMYISDDLQTIQRTPRDTENSTDRRDGILLADACAREGSPRTPNTDDDAPIPAELLMPPSAEMLKAASPEIITDKGTFLGERAWVLGIEPTSEIIEQLLWVPFLDRAMQSEDFAQDRLWILSDQEREAIAAGDMKISEDAEGRPWAFVWVTRDDRRIAQFDIRFEIDLGPGKKSTYRIFSHIFNDPPGMAQALDEIDLGGADSLLCG